ncbi:MAG TPA: DUF6760 family protein [Dehalococcoidia bacterium]|nr:DUF6760 family protein [Dehalococcoidia bacterium]
MTYPQDRLAEEVAYIAYHFHWPLDYILGLEHADRIEWAKQISRINERMNEESTSLTLNQL